MIIFHYELARHAERDVRDVTVKIPVVIFVFCHYVPRESHIHQHRHLCAADETCLLQQRCDVLHLTWQDWYALCAW